MKLLGAFSTAKFNAAFNAAKVIFDSGKKTEAQQRLTAEGERGIVQSVISSLAKNKAIHKTALNALQDERTLKRAYCIAQTYGEQRQKKPVNSVMCIPAGPVLNHGAISDFHTNKSCVSVYPSIPPSLDYASGIVPKTTVNFEAMPSQPVLHDSFAQGLETNSFTSSNQQSQPYGYAKFQFLASHFDELSAEPFDMIILEKKVDDQWIYALNKRTGLKGIMPLLYIDVKIPLPPTVTSSTFQMPFYAIALFDFHSSVPGDLTFRANDEIFVIENINNDWLRGRIGERQGIFPANYVREVTVSAATTTELTSCHASVEFVNALYDYDSGIEEDLNFKAGDRIEVLEWLNEDWLKGKLNGKIGLVPCTYIGESIKCGAGRQLNTVVTATKDYYNTAEDHLCFSKGDQIEVIEEVDNSWLKGKLLLNLSNTKCLPAGLFPRSAIL